MRNPAIVGQKMKNPIEVTGQGMGVRNGRKSGKGNTPWLSVRKKMRKSVFRGM